MRIGFLYGQPMNIMIEEDRRKSSKRMEETWIVEFRKENLASNVYPYDRVECWSLYLDQSNRGCEEEVWILFHDISWDWVWG
jgi:hypothetical protein